MSQADDTKNNDKAATVDDNESDDDLCEVDIPFSIIDDDSSDDDEAEQPPESGHTDKLNENIIMDCFNFSVNAHIKGKFEHVATNDDTKITSSEANKDEVMDKSNDDKEGATMQNQAESTKADPGNTDGEKGWFPAPLSLPAWAALD